MSKKLIINLDDFEPEAVMDDIIWEIEKWVEEYYEKGDVESLKELLDSVERIRDQWDTLFEKIEDKIFDLEEEEEDEI